MPMELDWKKKHQILNSWNYHRELTQVEAKLSDMEESSRRMVTLEKQQAEAESLLKRTEEELNTKDIADEINRLK